MFLLVVSDSGGRVVLLFFYEPSMPKSWVPMMKR